MADQPQTTDPNPKALPSNAGKELGQSGTLIYSGIITAEEYNRKLMGLNGIRIYDEMRLSDSGVQEMLKACKLPIFSVTMSIEPASDDEQDQFNARFVERELFDRNVNFHDFKRDSFTMFDYGFSVFEKVLELTQFEGKSLIGIKKLGSRKQRSILKWETQDHQPGVTQQVVGDIVSIPEVKLVVFTNDKEGENYQGISLLRYAYKDYDIRNKLIIANAVSLEKLGGGVPVLTAPPQPDAGDLEKARQALRNMRINQEAYVELPSGWGIEMLDMKSNTVKDMLPTIEYHETMMKKSVLAAFLDLGQHGSGGGSRALSQDHSQLFEKSLEAAANNFVSTVNEDIIQQLCDLNFSSMPNGYPKLTFGNIGDEDLAILGEFLNKLAAVDLITGDPELEEHLRDIARLPNLPDYIKDDYENRMVNSKSLQRLALAPAGTDPNAQPGATPPAAPKVNTNPGPQPNNSNNTQNLPVDQRNQPVPVNNSDKVKADVIADAQRAKQKLIDVILG